MLLTCDLLMDCADVHPVIKHYQLDSSDIAVNDYAMALSPQYHTVLMKYWDDYKADMIQLFETTYPRKVVPKWAEYDGFKRDKLIEMAHTLFDWLCDSEYRDEWQGKFMAVDFSDVLGFAFCASSLDYNATSRATDMISIAMAVNTTIMNDAVARNS